MRVLRRPHPTLKAATGFVPTNLQPLREIMPEVRADLYAIVLEIDKKVTEIAARCSGCNDRITSVESVLHGNGQPGIIKEVETLKAGKVDTLSVKSVGWLITSLAGAIAVILGAVKLANNPASNGLSPAAAADRGP
jgi:hypothetical protein